MENLVHSALADDGTVIVTVLGEIDFANADAVSQGIQDAVTRWAPSTVSVDLKDASFIDSTGLGALIEGYRMTAEIGCRFLVINPTDCFRRVLTVTGLGDLFGLGDSAKTTGASFEPSSATSA
jgi:anti-sigma B factor antagonist